MAERVSNGFYVFETEVFGIDPDEARKQRQALAERYNAGFDNLALLDRNLSINASRLIRLVCVEDRDPAEAEVGDIRVGLNSLGRVLLERRG
jgi:hypothetical protein